MEPEAAADHEGEYICPTCVSKAAPMGLGGAGDKESQPDAAVPSPGTDNDAKSIGTMYEAELTEVVRQELGKLFDELKVRFSRRTTYSFL